jgi:hypothetical protein
MATNVGRQESPRIARRRGLVSGLLLLALGASTCGDSGHRLGSTLDGASVETGASGGSGGSGTGGAQGRGGSVPGTGGSSGSGGASSSGGVSGSGGSAGTAGTSGRGGNGSGTGGRGGNGGAPGTGGNSSGTGGRAGSGGAPGTGGSGSGTGGRAGTGGVSGTGGASSTGGASGTGGAAMPDGGAGGGSGAGEACSGKMVMECAEGLVCDLDVAGRCLASTAGGHCTTVPVSCDTTGPSVCGCDGRTYATDCDRRRFRAQLDHAGVCAAPDGGAQPVVCGAVTCAQAELCVRHAPALCPGARIRRPPAPLLCPRAARPPSSPMARPTAYVLPEGPLRIPRVRSALVCLSANALGMHAAPVPLRIAEQLRRRASAAAHRGSVGIAAGTSASEI